MEEFREIVNLKPVLLRRVDLVELEHVITDEMHWPEHLPPTFEIEDGSRRIRAISVSDLLARNVPKTTRSLHARVSNWTGEGRIDGGVSLTLYHNFGNFQIDATSQGRFLAKKHQLLEFFAKHKPWYAPLVWPFQTVGGALAWVAFIFGIAFSIRGHWLAAGLLLGTALITGFCVFLTFTGRLFPHVRIVLEERASTSRREVLTIALEAALLVATIVGIFVQLANKQ